MVTYLWGDDVAAADGKVARRDVLLQSVSVMPDALKRLPPVAAAAVGWKITAVARPSAHARVGAW